MADFTKEELEALLQARGIENTDLEIENDELREIAQKALEGMKQNRLKLEESQRIIEYLLDLITTHIDSKFTLDDIPKLLS